MSMSQKARPASAVARGTTADRIDADTAMEFVAEVFGQPGAMGVVPTFGDLDYLREHGEWFDDPQLRGLRRGRIRGCYENAMRATWADARLTYVQGLVMTRFGVVVAHAWCVDDENRLVELTWTSETLRGVERYFGVRLSRQDGARLLERHRRFMWFEGFSAILAGAQQPGQRPRGSDPA